MGFGDWLSQFDPTSTKGGNNWSQSLGPAGWLYGALNPHHNDVRNDQQAMADRKQMEQDAAYERQLRDQLSKGGFDQGVADRYNSEAEMPIAQGQSQASEAVAARAARTGTRGAGGQQAVTMQAANQRSMARQKSIDLATTQHRQDLLSAHMANMSNSSINSGLYGSDLGIASQLEQLKQQDREALLKIIGTGAGFAIGGPAGGMAGSQLGGGPQSMFGSTYGSFGSNLSGQQSQYGGLGDYPYNPFLDPRLNS